MLILDCPHCGPRNSSEFRHAGTSRERPDATSVTAEKWRDYLYTQQNAAGWVRENWYHAMGCRRYIAIERDTVTNRTRPSDARGATPRGTDATVGTSADSNQETAT